MALYTDGQPREKEENELELSLPTPLRIAYYLLTRKVMFVDLGEDYFDKQKQAYQKHPNHRFIKKSLSLIGRCSFSKKLKLAFYLIWSFS